ncbi:hypothetical protein ACFVYP_38650 [Kitasatospora sp. NPDC058201]|uniref:hypothetical protein n=1 Tax=unclassified Kitasatospora TaxID=2633591 RepID=UPI00365ABB26
MRRTAMAAVVSAAVLAIAAVGPAGPPVDDGAGAAAGQRAPSWSGDFGGRGGFDDFDDLGGLGDLAGTAGTAGSAGADALGGFGRPGDPAGTGGGRLRVLAGVLRQDRPGSGWYLVGGAHLALGLQVVSADHEQIVLRFPPARRVVSVLCGPDETYAPQGFTCGASVSLDRVTVRLGRNGRPADPAVTSAGEYANFWLLGLVERR